MGPVIFDNNVLRKCSGGYQNCVAHRILEAEARSNKSFYSLQRFVAAADVRIFVAEIITVTACNFSRNKGNLV